MRMYAWTGGDKPSDVGAGAKALVDKMLRADVLAEVRAAA